MRWTQAELDAYHARGKGPKPRKGLLEYEAQRQKRRAAVEDKPTEKETIIQQRGVAMARERMQLHGYDPRLLFAVPNGADVSDANRMRLVAEGMTAGVPDLFLPVAQDDEWANAFGIYLGLWIEVKRPKIGRMTSDQNEMRELLEAQAYKYVICYSAEEIRDAVIDYLGINSPPGGRSGPDG